MKQDYLQMRVMELAREVYVTGQVYEDDLKLIAKQNVRTILDNRAEDEVNRPPLLADLKKTAEELGMTFVHYPVDPGPITDEAAEAYAHFCDGLERPLLIFGQSPARSMKIWEMGELQGDQ